MRGNSFRFQDVKERALASRALTHEKLQADMARMLRVAAEPVSVGETVEQQIARAGRRIGIAFVRARKYWYGDVKRVLALEYLRAQEATRGMESLDSYLTAKEMLIRDQIARERAR